MRYCAAHRTLFRLRSFGERARRVVPFDNGEGEEVERSIEIVTLMLRKCLEYLGALDPDDDAKAQCLGASSTIFRASSLTYIY